MQRLLCLIFSLTCVNSIYSMKKIKLTTKNQKMSPEEIRTAAMNFLARHFTEKNNTNLHPDFLKKLQNYTKPLIN